MKGKRVSFSASLCSALCDEPFFSGGTKILRRRQQLFGPLNGWKGDSAFDSFWLDASAVCYATSIAKDRLVVVVHIPDRNFQTFVNFLPVRTRRASKPVSSLREKERPLFRLHALERERTYDVSGIFYMGADSDFFNPLRNEEFGKPQKIPQEEKERGRLF